MNSTTRRTRTSSAYPKAAVAAFVLAIFIASYSIYYQFFYIDQTWLHGLISYSFEFLSGAAWFGILFVFRRLLNKEFRLRRFNNLLDVVLVCLAICTLIIANMIYANIELYLSLDNGVSLDSLLATGLSSFFLVILLVGASYALILFNFLLGIKMIRTKDVELKPLTILGWAFVVNAVISLLHSVEVIEYDMVNLLVKAALIASTGYFLKKSVEMDFDAFHAQREEAEPVESPPASTIPTGPDSTEVKPEPTKAISPEGKPTIPSGDKPSKPITDGKKSKKTDPLPEAMPRIDIEAHEDAALIIGYYEELNPSELSRLEIIIEKKYDKLTLTAEQKKNLVLQYIAEKKPYDHKRYFPS